MLQPTPVASFAVVLIAGGLVEEFGTTQRFLIEGVYIEKLWQNSIP